MKYLLCYDGSEYAQAALDQLLGMVRETDAVTVFGATEVTKKKLSDIGISYGTPGACLARRRRRRSCRLRRKSKISFFLCFVRSRRRCGAAAGDDGQQRRT